MVLLTNSPHQRDEQSSKRVPVGKRPGRLNGVVPLVTPLPCCLNTGGNLNLGQKKAQLGFLPSKQCSTFIRLNWIRRRGEDLFWWVSEWFPTSRSKSGLTQHNTTEEEHCLDLVQTVNNCLVQTTIVQGLPSFSLNPCSSLFSRARSTKLKLAEIVVLI